MTTPTIVTAEEKKPEKLSQAEMMERARVRRLEIMGKMRETPAWCLSRSGLAKEFGVSVPTITKDIQHIIDHWPKSELHELYVELDNTLKQSIHVLRESMKDEDPHVRVMAARGAPLVVEKYTEFLESFGRKQKVEQKVNIEVNDKRSIPDRVVDAVFTKALEEGLVSPAVLESEESAPRLLENGGQNEPG